MTTLPAGPIPCPACRQDLPPGAFACPLCGIRLSGPDAARLWQVDQTLAALSLERAELLRRLREPGPATAGAGVGGASGRGGMGGAVGQGDVDDPAGQRGSAKASGTPGVPGGVGTAGGLPTATRLRSASWTAQQVLLTGGVILLLVAALVFVAVSWERLGTVGQVAVLGWATVGAMVGARQLARHTLHASAEAVALLACGLALLDAVSIQQYGLFGSDRIGDAAYWTIALPTLTLVLLAGHALARRAYSYPLLTVVVAGLWPLALSLALNVRADGLAAVWGLAWVAGILAAAASGRARPAVRITIAAVSACWLLAASLLGSVEAARHPFWDGGAWASASLIAITTVTLVVSSSARMTGAARVTLRAIGRLLAVVTALIVLYHLGAWSMVALSAAGSAGLVASPLAARRPGRVTAAIDDVVGRAVGSRTGAFWLVTLTWGAGLVATGEQGHGRAHLSTWLAVACLAGATRSRGGDPGGRPLWAAYGACTGVLSLSVAVSSLTPTATVLVLCATGALLIAAAMTRRTQPEEAGLGAGACLAILLALARAVDSTQVAELVALPLAIAGVMLLGYSCLSRRGILAIPAVLLCSASTWSLSMGQDVTLLEAYTLPLAVLALAVGLIRRHRKPDAPSWTTIGPGLSAGLLPSAAATFGDEALTRPLLVLLAGVLTTAAGVVVREQAPVVTGVIATVLVAVSQAGPWVVALPRAASLGVAGLILLGMGLRYEATRRQAGSVGRWVRGLE